MNIQEKAALIIGILLIIFGIAMVVGNVYVHPMAAIAAGGYAISFAIKGRY